jgi:uncharacterized membrane-anchored protein
MKKEIEIVLRASAIGLMLLGAMMLVAGITSVVPFAAITSGLALTVVLQSAKRTAH